MTSDELAREVEALRAENERLKKRCAELQFLADARGRELDEYWRRERRERL